MWQDLDADQKRVVFKWLCNTNEKCDGSDICLLICRVADGINTLGWNQVLKKVFTIFNKQN
jgi:hypothetical protein